MDIEFLIKKRIFITDNDIGEYSLIPRLFRRRLLSPAPQPYPDLSGQAHETLGEEDDRQDQDDPDDNVSAKRDTGCLEPFPDNGERDSSDNRAGERTKSSENDVGYRPERVLDPV